MLTTGVAARRGYGEDSIYWVAHKNRYVGAISLGYAADGKRRRRTVFGRTKAEVRDKLKRLHEELEIAHSEEAPKYRVAEAVGDWLASLELDPATVANYKIMSQHVTRALGKRKLRELTAKEVRSFLEGLELSTRSRKLVHKILRDSIQHAMVRGLVARNVAATVTSTPRGKEGRPSRALSANQAAALLKAAEKSRLYAYVLLSLMTGVRTEEARALQWDHVALEAGTILVWRSVRAHGRTKTDQSRRTLLMPEAATEALRALQAAQEAQRVAAGTRWREHGLVFATSVGTPWSAGNIRREFRKICKAAGIGENWTPRELRHSFVSMLSADGVAVEDISHLVGHSSTRTTERIYRKELRPVLRTGAERMSRILNR